MFLEQTGSRASTYSPVMIYIILNMYNNNYGHNIHNIKSLGMSHSMKWKIFKCSVIHVYLKSSLRVLLSKMGRMLCLC